MITKENIQETEERIGKLEKILGSKNIVLDESHQEMKRETLYSRLNQITQLHRIIMDRDKNKPLSEFLNLCKLQNKYQKTQKHLKYSITFQNTQDLYKV